MNKVWKDTSNYTTFAMEYNGLYRENFQYLLNFTIEWMRFNSSGLTAVLLTISIPNTIETNIQIRLLFEDIQQL